MPICNQEAETKVLVKTKCNKITILVSNYLLVLTGSKCDSYGTKRIWQSLYV